MSLYFRCQYRYPAGFALDAEFHTRGKIVALFGPSGSGKTTILSLIAGLLVPQHGTIRFADSVWHDTAARIHVRTDRRRVGFVFHDHCLFPHLTVLGNLTYGLRRRKTPLSLNHIVETLDLQELLGRYPQTLSGGQSQRVALGRALLSGPALLLLDEPLTSVEADLREAICELLQRVVQQYRVPTIVVSHDAALVDRLADQVLAVRAGRILAASDTRE